MEAAREEDRAIGQGVRNPWAASPGHQRLLCTKGIRTTAVPGSWKTSIPPYDATVVRKAQGRRRRFRPGKRTWTSSPWVPRRKPPTSGSRETRDLERIPGGSSGGSAAAGPPTSESPPSVPTRAGPSASPVAVRHRGAEAHLRQGVPVRARRLRFVPGPDRPLHEGRRGLLRHDERHRRVRPRESTSVPGKFPITGHSWTGREGHDGGGSPRSNSSRGSTPRSPRPSGGRENPGRARRFRPGSVPAAHEYCVAIYYLIARRGEFQPRPVRRRPYGFRPATRDLMTCTRKPVRGLRRRSEAAHHDRDLRPFRATTMPITESLPGPGPPEKGLRRGLPGMRRPHHPDEPTPAFRSGRRWTIPCRCTSRYFHPFDEPAGIPGIAVPCGFSGAGLPIGAQFLAGHFEEGKLLRLASAYEKHADFEKRRPAL